MYIGPQVVQQPVVVSQAGYPQQQPYQQAYGYPVQVAVAPPAAQPHKASYPEAHVVATKYTATAPPPWQTAPQGEYADRSAPPPTSPPTDYSYPPPPTYATAAPVAQGVSPPPYDPRAATQPKVV